MTHPLGLQVLQLITDRDRRGAQVFATDLAGGLTRLGGRVETVALTNGTHGDLLAVDALGPSRRSLATYRELRRRVRSADVVIAHGSSTLMACAVALAGTNTPFIYRQISDPKHWAASWSRRLRVAAFLRRAAGIVVLSPSVAAVFAQHYWLDNERLTVVPNAVPGDDFQPPTADEQRDARTGFGLSPDRPAVLYAGALAEEKGVDMAVNAIADAGYMSLLIAGDGPQRLALEALAQRVAPGRVLFAGSLSELRLAFAAADVVVLPSRGGDSMPAVLIEAGLSGLPCVTTPVGAIPDVVIDKVTGRVVPIGDQSAFTEAVRELVDDRARRATFGRAAREHCLSRFTIEATAPAWMTLIKEVVERPRHRGRPFASRPMPE